MLGWRRQVPLAVDRFDEGAEVIGEVDLPQISGDEPTPQREAVVIDPARGPRSELRDAIYDRRPQPPARRCRPSLMYRS